MSKLVQIIQQVNDAVNQFVWGPVMLLVLLGLGIYLSFRTKFFQLTKFGLAMRTTIGSLFHKPKKAKKGGITPFQAVSTALAGTLGTGNIVGVSTAIVSGGPGAVFWMWVSAFFGMITKYAEVVLAIKFRRKNRRGEYVGGPMYYIEDGLHCKPLAMVFAFLCICASFGIGNMTQSNSVSEALESSFHLNKLLIGVALAVFVGMVMLGGVKRIGKITERVVPFMGIFYTLFAILVVFLNRDQLGEAFGLIFRYAFHLKAAAGGGAGYLISTAMRYGVSRGVFSNEAGLGSAPIAHAASDTDSPVKQGMWGIFEVFFDTIVMCTLTTLVILTSGLWDCGATGATLTLAAFSKTLGSGAANIVSISMIFFAFATIIGWSYYGEKCIEYLFKDQRAVKTYRIVYVIFVVVGATTNLTLIWSVSDSLNGLMAIPNIIALIALSSLVIRETKDYCHHPFRKSTDFMH